MKRVRTFAAFTCLAVSLLLTSAHRAFAFDPGDDAHNSHRTIILSATVNYSTNQLTVTGAHFPARPHLVLNDQELTLISATDTTIIATLPAAVVSTPGSYAFTMEQPRRSVIAPFIVTIGAVGPQGPIGLTGPQGTQGIQGIQGPVGPQGSVGPQGPAGSSLPPTVNGATFVGGVNAGTLTLSSATRLAQVPMTTGDFLIQAVVTGPSAVSDTLSCALAVGPSLSSTSTIASGEISLTVATNLPLLAAYSLPTGISNVEVNLYCATANSTESGITATLVVEPVTVGSAQQFTNSIGNTGPPILPGGWNRVKNTSGSGTTNTIP